jgi:predicted CXXCH cytochrome family protein
MGREGASRLAALRNLFTFVGLSVVLLDAQPAGNAYVGSKACFACHSAIFRSFQKTAMGHSMTPAADWLNRLPPQATVSQPGTSLSFSLARDEKGWRQTESDPGVFSVDHELAYAVGTNTNGLTFLVRRGRYLFQAPLSFYSKTGAWGLSPGYEHVSLGFSRMVPEECINCHAGRPSPVKDVPGAYSDPPFEELAIGCENCHGPGQQHVRSLGKQKVSIVNPAKLPSRLADNICLNCHQGGDARVVQPGKSFLDFRPGQWSFDTAVILKKEPDPAKPQSDLLEHVYAMEASRCFRASQGKLGCLSCHDPHQEPPKEQVASYYRAKCLTCHTDQSCRLPVASRKATTPADSCVGCHMPRRDVLQISHSELTNHRIPARPDEPAPAIKTDEQAGVIVVNPPGAATPRLSQVVLLQAYQQMSRSDATYRTRYVNLLDELAKTQSQDPYVQAALGDRAFSENRNDEAIAYLQAARSLNSPAVYVELGQALTKAGKAEEAIPVLKKAIELNPYDAVGQKTLILQYINQRSYAEAKLLMEQYVNAFPEDSFMRSMLQRVNQ